MTYVDTICNQNLTCMIFLQYTDMFRKNQRKRKKERKREKERLSKRYKKIEGRKNTNIALHDVSLQVDLCMKSAHIEYQCFYHGTYIRW